MKNSDNQKEMGIRKVCWSKECQLVIARLLSFMDSRGLLGRLLNLGGIKLLLIDWFKIPFWRDETIIKFWLGDFELNINNSGFNTSNEVCRRDKCR